MKKALTIALFFAAMFAVNSVKAQEVTKRDTSTKVSPVVTDQHVTQQQDTKSTTDKKNDTKTKEGQKSDTNNGTRMAISEQGMPVKKDKKKSQKAPNSSSTTPQKSTTNSTAPKQ